MALQLPDDTEPPLTPEHLTYFRDAARTLMVNALTPAAQRQAASGDHAGAVRTLRTQLLKVPGLAADVRARAETNLAVSLGAVREYDEAEAALERACAIGDATAPVRALALTTAATIKEHRADACQGAGRGGAMFRDSFYVQAKDLFREANA
eukprot:4997668-Prymnesium_polylepis.1